MTLLVYIKFITMDKNMLNYYDEGAQRRHLVDFPNILYGGEYFRELNSFSVTEPFFMS
jgi:hypothetical protein